MIRHEIGQTSRYYMTWVDVEGSVLHPNVAEFTVTDDDGEPVIEWSFFDDLIRSVDGDEWSVLVQIDHDADIDPGLYSYECRASMEGEVWVIISKGHLRVR